MIWPFKKKSPSCPKLIFSILPETMRVVCELPHSLGVMSNEEASRAGKDLASTILWLGGDEGRSVSAMQQAVSVAAELRGVPEWGSYVIGLVNNTRLGNARSEGRPVILPSQAFTN